jgi:hypothetical protein
VKLFSKKHVSKDHSIKKALFLCLSVLMHPVLLAQNNASSMNISVSEGTEIKASIQNHTARLKVIGCPDISGKITVGQGDLAVNIQLTETLVALQPKKDIHHIKNHCHYVGYDVAAVKINTSGLSSDSNDAFRLSPTFNDLDISIYRKIDATENEPGMYPEIELGWADSERDAMVLPLKRWNVQFKVYSFGAVIKTSEENKSTLSDSTLSLQMLSDGDLHLGGPVYLGGDLDNLIIYRWNSNASSWNDGKWEVGGFTSIFLEIRRDGEMPIALMALNFDLNNYVAEGTFALAHQTKWESAGFTVSLTESSLRAKISLKDGTYQLLGGEIEGEIKASKPIEGSLKIGLAWQRSQSSFIMSVKSDSNLQAFGVVCNDIALSINFNPDTLYIKKISGSVSLTHRDFSEGKINIQSLVIKDGELKEFLGSGRVLYKGFGLNINQASYTPRNTGEENTQPPELILAATMNLGWQTPDRSGRGKRNARIDVKNLKIINGELSSFNITGNVSAMPIDAKFSAVFNRESSKFNGSFSGSFGNNVAINGGLVVGVIPSPEKYSYGLLFFAFYIDRGVPIGQSGLMLTGINGAAGLNYDPKTGPKKNIYYLLGGLTIEDIAKFGSLSGEIYVVLGNTQRIGIKGDIKVTQRTPYFNGSVDANYILGSNELSGSITTTVKLPESGSIVSIDKLRLNYRVGNNRFALDGDQLEGDLFTFINIRHVHIDLNNRLDQPISNMSGKISGQLNGNKSLVWTYPAGYAPWGDGNGNECNALYSNNVVLDCECNKNTDDKYGIGIAGGFNSTLKGALSANLKNTGINSSFSMRATLNGSVTVTLPLSGWFGSSCAHQKNVSAYGELNATNNNGLLKVNGDLFFTTNDGWRKKLPFNASF